ncbi:MAG: hypothetical protein J6A15_09540 [Clostridia bacterium]|nr:hypothetical protein [Clostridia bacterium]
MEVKGSFDEIEIFIDDYKKQIENFCEKLGIDREDALEFLKTKTQEIQRKMEKIDSNVGKKSEYTKFDEIDEDEKYIFEALVGEKDLDYDNVDFSEIEEAQKEFNKLYLENEYAKSIVNEKSSEEIPENISSKVKEFFENQQSTLDELSKMDPDTAVKKFLNRKYPEIAEIIGDKLDLPDLYKRIDILPDNISEDIRNMFGDEYQGFVEEVQKRGKEEQEKLDNKIREYDKTYNQNVYDVYKKLTDEEKEEFLKHSDGEISSKILLELNRDVEKARENIKFSPIYNAYVNYCGKKEYAFKGENKIISNKIEEAIDDKIDVELDKIAEIRGHVMPYLGKKKDLDAANINIMYYKNLKEYLAPCLKSGDVKKSFNNMSEQNIIALREKALSANIDIRKVLSDISVSLESAYKEEADICGDMILEMSNYETDDTFAHFLENAYDDQMREELVSIAKYRIDDQRENDKKTIRYAYENEVKYSRKDLDEVLAFCNFKYNSIEYHLKDNASLFNVKVKQSDEIGLRKFLSSADKIAEKELEANRNILKAKDERIQSQTKQYLKLEPKKDYILSYRENMLNKKNIENEGLVYGG